MPIKRIIKQGVLARDQRKCVSCSHEHHKSKLQLHHILPQRLCGPDDMFNLVALCSDCHRDWHQVEEKRKVTWDVEGTVREFFLWLDYPEDDIEEEVDLHLDRVHDSLLRTLKDLLDPPRRLRSPKKAYVNRR